MNKRMISSQFIALLEEAYPIGSIQKVSALPGGEWNQVCHLHCDSGAFVLRISHSTTTVADLAYAHGVMGFMSRRIPEVLAPIPTYDGSTYLCRNDLLLTLFPLMPGRMLDRANEAECLNAARMLARLHKAGAAYPDLNARVNYPPLRELDWDHNRLWRWADVETLLFQQAAAFLSTERDPAKRACAAQIFARRSTIVREREACRDWLAALHASGRALRFGIIQGDYWRNNLLVNEGEICAVLDWDDCQGEWLVYELGRATWEFCKDSRQHTLHRPKAVRFLQAYQAAAGPVPATEFDLLLPFICCVRVIELLLGLQQAPHLGLDEHVLYHLLALENLRGSALAL
jgi:Ser/Thr protein kinase RdoA (MazF antagonist)